MSTMPCLRHVARLFWTAAFVAITASAFAEPVTVVRNNGPSANRIDIVVLGDGYSAAELAAGKYAADVNTMLTGLFAQQPYSEYRNYYNVRRIDVISAESGADHPERGTYKSTTLDAAYNCASIQRLICVNTSKVATVIGNSGIAADERDLTLVLVNDTTYGGSGGSVAVASLHPQTVELVLHETGHTFALLGDEYGGTASCTGTEPAYPDVTVQSSRASIKWNAWIDPATPIPTTTTNPSVPGLFTGGNYCNVGFYRPSYDSKMRTLGVPFYQVDQEAHVLRIYNFVSPIDGSSPAGTDVTIGSSQTFSVTPTVPASHALSTTWALDGVQQGTGNQFTLSNLASGMHTLTATVTDGTSWVRNDPNTLLSDVRTWIVSLPGTGPGAFNKLSPAGGATITGTTTTLSWGSSLGAAAYEYCIDTTNDNACTTWTNVGLNTALSLTGLSYSPAYYWHVRSSANGATTYADGVNTAFGSFSTTAPPLPAAFNKVGPTSGATGQSTSPTLSWGLSNGATSYEYCIDTTNDNACSTWVNRGGYTSVTLSGLASLTTYYWHVRASNANGKSYSNGSTTAFGSFTTQLAAPGAFAKSAPANNATGLYTSVSLTWNASSSAARYEYCIDTTNDNACGTWINVGTARSVTMTGLPYLTKYYWHVRAVNATGTTYSSGSATAFWNFTTGTGAPAPFGKSSPADKATGVATNPALSWAASTGATSYEYCIDTTNDSACSTWVNVGAATSVALNGLANLTTYYWHLRASNTLGTTYSGGSATAFRSFTTK